MVKASVIILNYKGKRFLKDCFESLRKQTFKDFEVIFMDNASNDNSAEHVKEIYPKARIIENKVNLGFAGGNNLAYKQAKGEYVVLLNNDTIADKNWLKNMIKEADKDPNVALVGAICAPFNTPFEKINVKNFPHSTIGITGADIHISSKRSLYVDGASCLIRKKFFEKPFDEDFFCYAEDVYLSWLANLKGYKVVHSESKYLHYGSGASANTPQSTMTHYLVERNILMDFLIFYQISTLLKLLPLIALSRIVKILSKLFTFQFSRAWAIFRGELWFIFHLPKIVLKRKKVQKMRKVSDKEILKLMSCKMFNERESAARILNIFSCAYLKLMRIKTIENEARN
jgi:GT2 family glycosyltransferase